MIAPGFAGWAIDTLIASTLLMIAVLLVRTPVRKAFGAQLAYALWALPLLRLMLPSLPESWRQASTPISRASETITVFVIPPAATTGSVASASHHPSLGLIMAGLWGAGAAAFLAWHLVQHIRFCRRMLGTADRLADEQGVHVIASAAAPGPLAFGILRRYVAFPRDFADRYDADERALALAHEIGHHQRGDLIANWAALVVLALHWFNPVAWRAFRRFRADQELANDARVLAGRSATERHIYACAIVKAAHGGAVSAACHLHTITDLKGRLKMLTTSRASRRRLATGAASVAVLVAAGLAMTVSGTQAAASVTAGLERVSGLTLQGPPIPAAAVVGAKDAKRVVIVKDGKTVVYEGAEADRYIARHPAPVPPVPRMAPMPPMPQSGVAPPAPAVPAVPVIPVVVPPVTSENCGPDGGKKAYTITRRDGQNMVTVICADRIAAAAQAGQMTGADQAAIQHQAMAAALESLKSTRASMNANTSIPDKDRAEAIAEIDDSIKELQGEIADIGKN